MPASPVLRHVLAAGIFLAVLAGCSSTSIKDSWKDPAYAGPTFKQVLVVGVSKSDSNRRVFEDGFAAALRTAGVSATSSYGSLPESGEISNARLDDAVNKTRSDSVLVTRLLRVKKDVNVTPSYVSPGFYGRGFRGYYGGAYMAMPPDVHVYDVLTIETTLWNMKADKPVWSGTSELTEPGSVAKATEELAKVLITKMKADGVI